jgi:hypothetical protein
MKASNFKTVFRKKPGQNVGLILVRDCDPTKSCIGILVSNHRNMTDGILAEMLYLYTPCFFVHGVMKVFPE